MVCTVGLNFPIQLIHLENKVLCDQTQAAENLRLLRKLDHSLGIHIHHGHRLNFCENMILSILLENIDSGDYRLED